MSTLSQIIHAKWIIPCVTPNVVLEDHALLIDKQGFIKAIKPSKEVNEAADSILHFPTHAMIPGLINTHTHLAMNYFRGLADDLALMDWLNHHIWPAEKKWLSHEFVRDASLFAMAEMIRSGTTCFNDMYFFLEATAQAAEIAGMRAHIGMTVIEFPTPFASTTDEYFDKGMAFFERYKNHPRITATLAPHAPYTVSDASFLRIKALANEHHLKVNLHLHETEDEINQSLQQFKKRPIKRLAELGCLSSETIAIHMTHLNDEDLEYLSEAQLSIVHCPESNMKLASGACSVERLRERGLNVALGTDGAASNNDLNMLGEMRTAAFVAKTRTNNPQALPAAACLELATINGAKALGIDNLTGSLQVGKTADFALIQLDAIETTPVYHPISQIVYAASRHQVTDVWVFGKQLLNNRELTTLDEQALLAKAKHWGKKIRA